MQQEIELRRRTEGGRGRPSGAAAGGVVPNDYLFEGSGPDGSLEQMRFSQLFAAGKATLSTYNMMFRRAPDGDLPCPSCMQFLDSFDGVVDHASHRINVVIVVKAAFTAPSNTPALAGGASPASSRPPTTPSIATITGRAPTMSSSSRCSTSSAATATSFARWGSELLCEPSEPGQDPRHGDTIDPLWNLFGFMPEGRRTDWCPDLNYD